MKIATRDHLFGFDKDKRVVRGAVNFDFEDASRMIEGITHSAMHLRHTAQGIRILYARVDLMVAVRFANLAPVYQFAEPARAAHLPGMSAHSVNLVIESNGGSFQGLKRHRPRHICGI